MNARLDQVGLSSALRWAAAAGGHWQLMHEASATYRVVGGMSGFTQAIAADVAGEIRLGATVTRVAQAADGAAVTCGGGVGARARRVISTLPVNAIAGIEWEPGLPGAWQRANAETVASQGVKVWVKARGRVPRFFAYASQRHPISVLKTEFTDDDATVLVGFGPDHTQLDVTSVAGVQAAVDALRPGLEVVEVAAHDWMKDPLSRTTWMTHRPGQLTRDLAGLQRPAGAVHFASSDNATSGAASSTARSKAACARHGESRRSSHRLGRPRLSLSVTLPTGITSRPAFDPAPAGLVCRRPMGRWSRFLVEAASSGGTGTSCWNLRATRGLRVNCFRAG